MEFKDKIKNLRKEHSLTQEGLSNVLHVSRSLVAKWENGLGLPSEDTIKDICKYFNITEDKLFDKNDSINVIVKKNIKLKKKNIIIIILSIILSLIMFVALYDIVAELYHNHQIIKEKELIEELINSEDITINKLKLNDGDYNDDMVVYDFDNGIAYIKNYNRLVIDIKMDKTLYDSINIEESKIKLSIYDDYIDINKNIYYHLYNFECLLEVNTYDLLQEVYVEEIILVYNYKTVEKNKIVTKSLEKSYQYNNDIHWMMCFVKDFNINADINLFAEHLITLPVPMGTTLAEIINNKALSVLVQYKIEDLEEKYNIDILDLLLYDFEEGNGNTARYQDYSIDILHVLSNKSNFELTFSKDIYNMTLEKDKELELEFFINGVKCDDYKVKLYDKTNKLSSYVNDDNNIVIKSLESGSYSVELEIDMKFAKAVYILNIKVE